MSDQQSRDDAHTGFQTYADDTTMDNASYGTAPDDAASAEALALDFPATPEPRYATTRRRGRTAALLAIGIAVAAGAGILMARDTRVEMAEDSPMKASEPALNVQVASQEIPPTAPPTGPKLEVLTPPTVTLDPLTAVASPLPVTRTPPTRPTQAAASVSAPAAPTAKAPRERPGRPAAPALAPPAPAAPMRAAFDCAEAPTLALAMVCEDPALERLDLRMKQAYDAALSAGVPEALLREDQAYWLEARDDAAQRSPAAIASVYRQRIAELRSALR